METIEKAQRLMQEAGIDGWLLYDFKRSNSPAIKFLKIPMESHLTRRFCYYIPLKGNPIKIVHAIEEAHLDHLPGEKRLFTTWESFQYALKSTLKEGDKVALEYSKNGMNPYVSKVDAGFLELVKEFKVECVSSQDLLQHFTAVLSPHESALQKEAALFLERVQEKAFLMIESKKVLLEEDVQSFIMEEFEKGGFETDSLPICAFGENSANPHYSGGKHALKPGDPILLDLWCKKKVSGAVYGDITRMGFFGEPSERFKHVFNVVREAQKEAIELVLSRFSSGTKLFGFEVDDKARGIIEKAGFGPYFLHRTGHNIHFDTHGDGAHMDNFETHDDREVIAGTCFSIEPGIYLKGEFGVRLECDILIHKDGRVEVTGGVQDAPRVLRCP